MALLKKLLAAKSTALEADPSISLLAETLD
jgi:hypothetical protein